MLPHHDETPATDTPGGDSVPVAEGAPGEANGAADSTTAMTEATDALDQPVVPIQPVIGGGGRRRGWPFAISLVLVAILGGGSLFMSGYLLGRGAGLTPGSASDQAAWQPFWDVYKAITERYALGPVPRLTLVEGAIRGMVQSIDDPFSAYLSPDDFRGTLDDISGTFEGIGAEIGAVDATGDASSCSPYGPDCRLVVVSPIEGSPAEAAGLLAGDIIASVDGTSVDGLAPDEARDLVRGPAGTNVTLHIERYALPAPRPTAAPGPTPTPGPSGPSTTAAPRQLLREFDVTITRAKIQRREVTARELADGTVGYFRLTGFSDGGADQLDAALKADIDKGITRVILDLRGNPGGFVTDARRVASAFIADGPVFWQEDAKGVQTETDALGGGVATDPAIRIVVLIDGGTASASEIVAGALQDRGRATLVGQTSYGKGTVQEWLDLGEVGGVKLTVSKWLTPDKRWIHKVGLTPDVAVTVPADNPPGVDPVLDKALEILSGTAVLPLERAWAA